MAISTIGQKAIGTNVAGNGPAFSAVANANTTLPNGAYTKVNFQVEEFDTNNNFASSRFTPTVAGYYQLNCAVGFTGANAGETVLVIYKNGSDFKYLQDSTTTGTWILSGTCLAYANGTTDYFEVYVYQNASVNASGTTAYTFFQGFLARAA